MQAGSWCSLYSQWRESNTQGGWSSFDRPVSRSVPLIVITHLILNVYMWAGCLGFFWSQQSSEAWFRCFSIVAERHACQQLHLQKDPGLQYGMPYIALDILHTTGFLWIWQQGSFPDIHVPSTHVDFSIPAPEHSPPYLNGQKSIGMKGLQEDTSCVTLS